MSEDVDYVEWNIRICAYPFSIWLKTFMFSSRKQMISGSRYYARILLLKIFSVLSFWVAEWKQSTNGLLLFVLLMFLFVWYFRPPMCWKQRKVILMLLQFTQVGMILCVLSATVTASKSLLSDLLRLKICSCISLSIYVCVYIYIYQSDEIF